MVEDKNNNVEEGFTEREVMVDGVPTLMKVKNSVLQKLEEEKTIQEPKKENMLKKIWNATIFPDKIKAIKEEKELKRQMMYQAKQEALKELGPELKEMYKQQALDKMTGRNKKSMGEKLAKGFAMPSDGQTSGDKISRMLGVGNNEVGSSNKINQILGNSGSFGGDMTEKVLGPQPKKTKKTKNKFKKNQVVKKNKVIYKQDASNTFEEKIKKILE